MLKIKNKKIIILASLLILAAMVFGTYFYMNSKDDKKVSQSGPVQFADQGIDYGPPTEAEKTEAENLIKDRESGNTTTTQSGRKQVNPVVTYGAQEGQQVTINAFVGSIAEDGGTCTATFTKGNTSFNKVSKGFANVSNTNCEPLFVPVSDFASKGEWTLKIVYESALASGTSQETKVTIR